MREIVHIQAGQCGNQIGAKVKIQPFLHIWAKLAFLSLKKVGNFWREDCYKVLAQNQILIFFCCSLTFQSTFLPIIECTL